MFRQNVCQNVSHFISRSEHEPSHDVAEAQPEPSDGTTARQIWRFWVE